MLNVIIRSIVTYLLPVLLLNTTLYAAALSQKIDALIKTSLPLANIGILIKDAETNDILYSKHANTLLLPASGIKLLSSTAALYHWAPEHTFPTTLSQKGQDIYITFSGSPSLTVEQLETLLTHLEKANPNPIQGNIVLDTTQIKPPYYPDGVSYDDLGWYYTAPDTAAILNENMEAYEFISGKKPGDMVQIKPQKTQGALTLINEVVTVSEEKAKKHCNLNIDIKPNNTLKLYGCLAQSPTPKIMKLAVPEPILFAKQTIQSILETHHIKYKGSILEGKTPNDATHIATIQSDSLMEIVTQMLQHSNNLYANSLTKQLGYAVTGDGTNKQGTFAIQKILSKHTHLDTNALALSDGMGARYNLITAKQLTTLLTDIYHDKKIYPIFLKTLANTGVSGTLENRLKDTPLEKQVFAKTGGMHDVSSLSGYVMRPNAAPLIFSIIINGINTAQHDGKVLEDKILLTLNEHFNQPTTISVA